MPETKTYLYRRGDGNEGNFPCYLITLGADVDPYLALAACVANDFIPGYRVRRHIIRTLELDSDFRDTPEAACYEGPRGERAANDSAWLSAQFEPLLSPEDHEYYNSYRHFNFPQPLDAAARRQYREALKAKAERRKQVTMVAK